jgi:hypothetical protein
MALLELQALRVARPDEIDASDVHYWTGIARLHALDWAGAVPELRRYLTAKSTGVRAGWAFLHLGRALEEVGHDDEASLAYRGCLSVSEAERPARRLAFDLMSRIATELPMGYGQATSRPAERRSRR